LAVYGEDGLDPVALDGQGCFLGGLAAGVAFGEVVVVGTDQYPGAAIGFLYGLGDGLEVAGVEGDGDGQAGHFVQRCARCVAFGNKNHVQDGADEVESADLGQAAGEVFLFQQPGAPILAAQDLQAPYLAGGVAHGDGGGAVLGRVPAHAVGLDALAGEVFALTGARAVAVPDLGGAVGGIQGQALAFGLGLLAVFGELGADGGGLVGVEGGSLDLDLLCAVVVAAPDAIGADDQQPAILGRDFVQGVPTPLLAVALDLAAPHTAEVQVVEDQAHRTQLGDDGVVVLHRAVARAWR